jgi:predicted DNA-binding antitoxin AbrB/MazE fold protein
MAITVEAGYENGTLKLRESLPFKEHEQVRVTIRPMQQPTGNAGASVPQSYGLIGWSGSHEELEQILADAEKLENLP